MKSMNGFIRFGCRNKLTYALWNDKFPADKVCFEDDRYLIHFDGVLLNSEELNEVLGCSSNRDILLKLYQLHGAQLVYHTKGLYALVIWDKQAQKMLITNDLLSKRSLFYHMAQHGLYYGSSYHDLLDLLSETGCSLPICKDALEDMLQRGFVNGNKTYLQGVFCLNAFESLMVDLHDGSAQLLRHPIKTCQIPPQEAGAIDGFQALFSKAVMLQFRKNVQSGYGQCATLSGGMDSRACLLSAFRQGYDKDILCFNYAQSGSLDYSISQQIAADLGLDYLFYPMDAAPFLSRLDDAMELNECMQSGIGATGARTMARLLNTSDLGLVNIGICGGELMGDLVRRNRGNEPANRLLRMAGRVFNKLREELTHPAPKAEDYIFDFQEYLCHLRASQNFAHMFIDKCECLSPFMDEDVVMYVLQLNPGWMYNRQFYRKWMIKYLPNPYIVTSSCARVDSTLPAELLGKLRYRILSKRHGVHQSDMNPIIHWFETQPRHQENCIREFEAGCVRLKDMPDGQQYLPLIEESWNRPWLKRLYVLSALQAIKDLQDRFANHS